jgi:hypothetical protein
MLAGAVPLNVIVVGVVAEVGKPVLLYITVCEL